MMIDETTKTTEVSTETVAKAPTDEAAKVKDATPKNRKKKAVRQVRLGQAHVQATYNNTVVTLSDLNGNVLTWSSAGRMGFRGPKKSTPYAAGIIVKDVVERVKPYGLEEVHVFVRGVGAGREAAIRALHAQGVQVLSIKDITPIPHNGCRPPRPRRV